MSRLSSDASACADLLSEDDGLDAALGLVADALPKKLRETSFSSALVK